MYLNQAFCMHCGQHRLVKAAGVNHILHLLLTVVTGGLWIIPWCILAMRAKKWRCSECGSLVDLAEEATYNQKP